MAGLKTLAFVLSVGFLLAILPCALYNNWWPILGVITYILAPLPNALCSRFAGEDDLMSDYNSGAVDAGHFITGMFIVSGFCLPLVLAHAQIINTAATVMSISGGLLIYGTIISYAHFFSDKDDSF